MLQSPKDGTKRGLFMPPAPQSRSRATLGPIVTNALQKTHDARDPRKGTVATRPPPNNARCIRHYYVLPVKFANSVALRPRTDHE